MDDTNRKPAPENTLIRDRMALTRTVLANERTLLAYVRTALALIITGLSILHFLEGWAKTATGVILVLMGIACFAWGAIRYRRMKRIIRDLAEDSIGDVQVHI